MRKRLYKGKTTLPRDVLKGFALDHVLLKARINLVPPFLLLVGFVNKHTNPAVIFKMDFYFLFFQGA